MAPLISSMLLFEAEGGEGMRLRREQKCKWGLLLGAGNGAMWVTFALKSLRYRDGRKVEPKSMRTARQNYGNI